MGQDAVPAFHIYRACLKICFHNAETFFDFPTALIHSDNRFRPILQVCADSVETIKLFLGIYKVSALSAFLWTVW